MQAPTKTLNMVLAINKHLKVYARPLTFAQEIENRIISRNTSDCKPQFI